jgi:hypothetical protein
MPTGCPCFISTSWTLIKMACRSLETCWLKGVRCMCKNTPEARTITLLHYGRLSWTIFVCSWKTRPFGRVKSTLLCSFTTARFLRGYFQPNFLLTTCVYYCSRLPVLPLLMASIFLMFLSFLCTRGLISTPWRCSRSAHLETWTAITLWQFNFACLSRWAEHTWVAVGTVGLDRVVGISLLDLEVFWVEPFTNVLVFCTFAMNWLAVWSYCFERSYYAEI